MTGCAWRLTRGPPRDLDPSEKEARKLKNEVEEMRSESFVFVVFRAESLS